MITIVDYDAGNPRSIINMLQYLGIEARISGDAETVAAAERLILPGVGKFDWGMQRLHDKGLVDALNHAVQARRKPILGICLGAQLLTRASEEGDLPGLGWIAAETRAFETSRMGASLRIPHIGWSDTSWATEKRLTPEDVDPRYYYVHSYHLHCDDPADELCRTRHGYDFTAGVERGHIYGVQFHPEKSLAFGMAVLRRFSALDG